LLLIGLEKTGYMGYSTLIGNKKHLMVQKVTRVTSNIKP